MDIRLRVVCCTQKEGPLPGWWFPVIIKNTFNTWGEVIAQVHEYTQNNSLTAKAGHPMSGRLMTNSNANLNPIPDGRTMVSASHIDRDQALKRGEMTLVLFYNDTKFRNPHNSCGTLKFGEMPENDEHTANQQEVNQPPQKRARNEVMIRDGGVSAANAIERSNYVQNVRQLSPLVQMDPNHIEKHMKRLDIECPVELDTTKIRACLGLVRDKDDKIIGGCFKIAPCCLMTCFHVHQNLGREPHLGSYDFPYLGGKVESPIVVRLCEGFDIAIIKFDRHGGNVDGRDSFLKLQTSPSFISMKNDAVNELPVLLNKWDGNEITHPRVGFLRQFESVHVLHTIPTEKGNSGFPLIDSQGNAFALHRAGAPQQTPRRYKCNLAVRFDLWLRYEFSIGDEHARRSRREGEAFFRDLGVELLTRENL